MEYLQQRDCAQYYNSKDFEHIYRKYDGANGNPWTVGLRAADYILINAKPKDDETGND